MKEKEMEIVRSRVNEFFSHMGLTKIQMAYEMGRDRSRVAEALAGKLPITEFFVLQLCAAYRNLNQDWLYGKSDVMLHPQSDFIQKLVKYFALRQLTPLDIFPDTLKARYMEKVMYRKIEPNEQVTQWLKHKYENVITVTSPPVVAEPLGNYGDLSQAIAKLYMQVDSLTKENIELKDLLKKNGIPYGG